MFQDIPYDREKAVAYAHAWAYRRNPRYLDFSNLGGDCTNFASQCIFAGAGYMNYTPVYGWYYINARDRSASWTGVQYLYNFLTSNKGAGPFAAEVPISALMPGDIVQLSFNGMEFQHTPFVVSVEGDPSPATVRIAAHSSDCDCRPLNTYLYRKLRCIHIEGVRRNT